MAAARVTGSETIRLLAGSARASDHPAPSDEVLELLEDTNHVGVIVRVEDENGAPSERLEDARAWLVWLLKLRGDDGRYMVTMVNGADELSRLQELEVTDEVATAAVEFARECF